MRTKMKIIIVLFSVLSIVLCETVIEDKAENVQNGGEIISEKVITESVSSGGSVAVGNVGGIQKIEDEKILDHVYNKGNAAKDLVLDGGITLSGKELFADSQLQGGKVLQTALVKGMPAAETLMRVKLVNEEALKASSSKLSAAEHAMISTSAEKLRHHMIGDEQLKKQAGIVHHQTAAGHKIPEHHLPENHHIESIKHNPIHLHGSKIISEQNKHIQEVSEIQTTKIIHEKVTNHQISSQIGHDHINPVVVHYPVAISREIINPHAQKLMYHNHADHMIPRPVVHDKLPVNPPIVPIPYEETMQQLAAIRLINQQLQEAMIQNQQAALVGLEIQRHLEIKGKQQKLLASHYVPHVVHLHEHVPTSGHALPMIKPRDHLVNHGHHHATVLGDAHTSVNKHELSRMRHLANEMHSPHIVHPKVVHNTQAVQNAALAASVGKESLLRTSVAGKVLNEETAKKHGVGAGIAIGKVNNEGSVGIRELVEKKAIASDLLASERSGLETVKENVKGSLAVDDSLKKMDAVKKIQGMIPVPAMIRSLDPLADKSLKEMNSFKNIKGTVINKGDVTAEKSLIDLSQVKKNENIASESTFLKSANVVKEETLKAKDTAKKIEVAGVDGAFMNAENIAVSQKTADTVKKTEGFVAQGAMLNTANVVKATLKDDTKKTALSEDEILKSSKVTDAVKNIESVRLGSEALNVAIVADKKLKEKEVDKRTGAAIAGSAVNKEASILGDKLIKELSAVNKREDETAAIKQAKTKVTSAEQKINSFKETDNALAKDSVLKEVDADKSVKEADVSKTEIFDAGDANIGLKAVNIDAENAFKPAFSTKKTESGVAQGGALKSSIKVADSSIKVADNNKQTGGSVIQDVALKTRDIFAGRASKVADTVKKAESTVAENAGMEIANIATDNAVKVAGAAKKTEGAVVQNRNLKITDIIADMIADSVVNIGKKTESANLQDARMKAANVVTTSSIKLEDIAKKTESAEGNSIVKETDLVADKPIKQVDSKKTVGSVTQDSIVKTASIVAGNVLKQTDNSKSAEGLAMKSEEVVANKAENTVKELETDQKSEGAVGVSKVINIEISDLKKDIEKKESDTEKQLLQQSLNAVAAAVDKRATMPVQGTTSDTPKMAAAKNAVAFREINDGNGKTATVNEKSQDVGVANFASRIDDALVKQESQEVLADQSQQMDDGKGNSDDTVKNSKATQQLKVDNETLRKASDKKVAIVESVSGKDLIKEGVNEQLKNGRDPEEMKVNVKNAEKKEDEKKIDILQKSMVDERMAPPIATGGDTSKNGPIFTLRGGSP